MAIVLPVIALRREDRDGRFLPLDEEQQGLAGSRCGEVPRPRRVEWREPGQWWRSQLTRWSWPLTAKARQDPHPGPPRASFSLPGRGLQQGPLLPPLLHLLRPGQGRPDRSGSFMAAAEKTTTTWPLPSWYFTTYNFPQNYIFININNINILIIY